MPLDTKRNKRQSVGEVERERGREGEKEREARKWHALRIRGTRKKKRKKEKKEKKIGRSGKKIASPARLIEFTPGGESRHVAITRGILYRGVVFCPVSVGQLNFSTLSPRQAHVLTKKRGKASVEPSVTRSFLPLPSLPSPPPSSRASFRRVEKPIAPLFIPPQLDQPRLRNRS